MELKRERKVKGKRVRISNGGRKSPRVCVRKVLKEYSEVEEPLNVP